MRRWVKYVMPVLLGGIGLMNYQASALICHYHVNDPLWKGNAAKNVASVNRAYDGQLATSSALITSYLQALVSASRVQSTQKAMESRQNSIGINKSLEAFSQVLNRQAIGQQMLDAYRQFGEESHIADTCKATETGKEVIEALGNTQDRARTVINSGHLHAAPGTSMTGQESVGKRLAAHESYCGPDEVRAGLCRSVGSHPSADVSSVTFFDPDSSPKMVEDYLNNLVGDPLGKPSAREAQTPQGALRLAEAVRVEALRSPALDSLAVLRAEISSPDRSHPSVLQSLDDMLDLYGGGPRYQQWDARLSATNQTGVLRELIRLKGLEMKLRSYQSESMTRTSAILSILLAAEANYHG